MNYFWAFVTGGAICVVGQLFLDLTAPVSYTNLRAPETSRKTACRLLLGKKKTPIQAEKYRKLFPEFKQSPTLM